MANRGPSYGLSAECQKKADDKFSVEGASMCLSWVEQVLGRSIGVPRVQSQDDFHAVLKDGTLLCEMINTLSPGSVKKINRTQMVFKQRENIEQYLEAVARYGLDEQYLFQVNDLFEAKNLYLIVNNLHLLGIHAQKQGFRR